MLGEELRQRYIKAPEADGVTTIVENLDLYDSAKVQVRERKRHGRDGIGEIIG